MTSPGPVEGKYTTVANLEVVLARTGLRTVVIDADLRRPTQYSIFDVRNTLGLATLLTHPEQAWRHVVKEVALSRLAPMPSGPIPPNPQES